MVHLGNVLVTISDRHIAQDVHIPANGTDFYLADLLSATDYYAFGQPMPGRQFTLPGSTAYRFGYNGQERSTELYSGHYTAQYWEYDSRIGRRWEQDPIKISSLSPYTCFGNNPILFNDVNGDTFEDGSKAKAEETKQAVNTRIGKLEKTLKRLENKELTVEREKQIEDIKLKLTDLKQFEQEYRDMDESDQVFRLKPIYSDESRTSLDITGEKPVIVISYFDDTNLIHEMKHGHQALGENGIFMTIDQKTAYGILIDYQDEIAAYRREYAFTFNGISGGANSYNEISADNNYLSKIPGQPYNTLARDADATFTKDSKLAKFLYYYPRVSQFNTGITPIIKQTIYEGAVEANEILKNANKPPSFYFTKK